jgi:Mg-chelatase subunit ChlD
MTDTQDPQEQRRRWALALGDEKSGGCLSGRDQRLDRALSELYGGSSKSDSRRGGLGGSAPRVARWLGDIREFFPASVVQVIQRDAFTRLNLKQMLLEPELLSAIEADVHLIADLISLRGVMPEKTKETARKVVNKVVKELMARLESKTRNTIRGVLKRGQRTYRPRHSDIDWNRTIRANLRHWQKKQRTIVPETLIGFARKARTADLDEVILCVDQSGSMATSVVYSSIFAAVLASIPAIKTQLVVFDTAIYDMTEDLADPVDVLFGIQLGGGTDINQALAYCENKIATPSKTHLVLITDLYEGGNTKEMLARAAALVGAGVNLIVLLALSDDGHSCYDSANGAAIAALGAPVFACTPDLFPDMMATALKRGDMGQWAAANDILTLRGG